MDDQVDIRFEHDRRVVIPTVTLPDGTQITSRFPRAQSADVAMTLTTKEFEDVWRAAFLYGHHTANDQAESRL